MLHTPSAHTIVLLLATQQNILCSPLARIRTRNPTAGRGMEITTKGDSKELKNSAACQVQPECFFLPPQIWLLLGSLCDRDRDLDGRRRRRRRGDRHFSFEPP